MSYRAYLTHNPQDFFEGAEPEELQVIIDFENVNSRREIAKILMLVSSGYKAIIFQKEETGYG